MKINKIDLHTHSAYSSDGEFTPTVLVQLAARNGLTAMALTDHNTMDGIKEAILAGEEEGVEIIPGIEIDSQYDQYPSIHLLGYYLDPASKLLIDFLASLRERYFAQAKKRISRLNQMGFKVSYQEVMKITTDIPVGVILAEAIITNGKNDNHPGLKPYLTGGERADQPYFNFYLDFFTKGKKAYIPCQYPSSIDVIKLINKLGGVSVLAHPGSIFKAEDQNDQYAIKELIKSGLSGVEAYSSYHTPVEMKMFSNFGKANNLIITAGSDFHGKLKPLVKLGGIPNNDYQLLLNLKTADRKSK